MNYSQRFHKQPPKVKTYWSFTEGGCLEESNHKVSLPSGPDTVQKIINFIASNFMQFHASYDMCSSMLSLKVLHIHVVQVA